VPDYLKEVLMNLLPTLGGSHRASRPAVQQGRAHPDPAYRIRRRQSLEAEDESLPGAAAWKSSASASTTWAAPWPWAKHGKLLDIELPAVMREDSPH
jgi:hypothetical protein